MKPVSELAAAIQSAGNLRIVLSASPAGGVMVEAQRWQLGDPCVSVVGCCVLDPDIVDAAALAAAIRRAVAG